MSDSRGIRVELECERDAPETAPLLYEKAGPRQKIFFDPPKTTAAIVTCGGISPGINNVIRSAFYELRKDYGVGRVLGIRNGFLGLVPESGRPPVELTDTSVDSIDRLGGTVLSSSRGPQDVGVMVDFLQAHQVDILLCVGGDGTQRGAFALHREIARRGLQIAVVGVPKTIDNDIAFVQLAFGYTTALEKAAEVIQGAHVEARGAPGGIGLVKLMGRHAGFIAAGATVVSQEVNFTLVPEIPFSLESESGFLGALERRILARDHAVIVVAEGAGQHLFETNEQTRDASGNIRLRDIGGLLRERIERHFHERDIRIALKYLDPSYHIRSVPANAYDRFLCDQLARHATHAAMAGKTAAVIGFEHGQFIHVPMPTLTAQAKKLDPSGDLWRAVLEVTGQPRW